MSFPISGVSCFFILILIINFLVISDCSVRILIQRSCSSSPTQTLPLLGSDQQLVLNFHADLQNLYAAVVQHSNARRRKRQLSEEERPAAEDADVSPQGLFGFRVWKTSCGVSRLHSTRFLLPRFFLYMPSVCDRRRRCDHH